MKRSELSMMHRVVLRRELADIEATRTYLAVVAEYFRERLRPPLEERRVGLVRFGSGPRMANGGKAE